MKRRKAPRLMSGEWQRCLAAGRLGWGPLDYVEIREVTPEDVPVAALIGQILAESRPGQDRRDLRRR